MGDPNIHKLLERGLSGGALETSMNDLCEERLRRFQPLFESLDLERLVAQQFQLRWLDLGSNDGTILLALKRQYPSLDVFGLEHRYEEYVKTYDFLQSYAQFMVKGGSWYDDVYPAGSFDIVSSIHAWPCPRDYLTRAEEVRQARQTGQMYQDVLFDKDFSLAELRRFMTFVKPGGYLLVKTWQTPLEPVKGRFRLNRNFPFITFQAQQESYNITRQELSRIGEVIYLQDIYLILRNRTEHD